MRYHKAYVHHVTTGGSAGHPGLDPLLQVPPHMDKSILGLTWVSETCVKSGVCNDHEGKQRYKSGTRRIYVHVV